MQPLVRLLAVETSSPRGSLCIAEIKNGKLDLPLEKSWEKQGSHSEVISEIFLELLQQKKWNPHDLTHIAVGIGPGSFTGIRVGLNFAKALAYGLKIPIIGINSLEILANGVVEKQKPVICLVNAFKNQIFAATYLDDQETRPPQVITPQEVQSWVTKPHLCLGDALEIYQSSFAPNLLPLLNHSPENSNFPLAENLATKVARDYTQLKFTDWKSVNPLYIRAASAEEKLKDGDLRPQKRF